MKFKKCLAVLLAFHVMMLGKCVWAEELTSEDGIEEIIEAEEVSFEDLSTNTLAEYEVGECVQGFTLKEERELRNPSALLRIWEHDKTGALAYFIHNDDKDRTFSIAFRTEPSDDTGKLHILEHAVCAASENYPGQDVFFDAVAQAYITDINATTYKSATNYYVSSMSEDQLERMADFYLDCAFHSALRSEPNYFYREGWRYTMEDEEAPLTIDGIVYNEMKGMYGDIYSMHYYHGMENALFPDTYQKWESGGYPVSIPDLSYDELISFYDECYHPSNSISMFYGDVETERYLKLMDEEYFSKFEAQESAGYSKGQEAFSEMAVYEQDFPVSADSTQTGGLISFAVVLPENVDFNEILALSMGEDYLGDVSSPLMEALYASGIGSDYYVESSTVGTQYIFLFTADEADTSRAEEFKDIVTENLAVMLEEGFDKEMLDSIFAEAALSNALVSNQEGVGIEMASRIAMMIDSGYEEFLDPQIDEVQKLCENGGLENLINKYVMNNTHSALITTTPKAGLLEEEENAETERLAAIKSSISQEEIEKIIADTAAFQKWNEEADSVPETLEKLRTETPDTVPSELPVYETSVLEKDGVKIYTADVEGEATYCRYIFNLSHLTKEEIRVLDLYLELMGGSTEKRSQREISIAKRSLLSDVEFSVNMNHCADGCFYPALSMSFYSLDENLKDAAELVMEMFEKTDLSENEKYFDTAISTKMQEYYDAESVADNMAYDAALADSSEAYAFQYELFGMEYYTWLTELGEMDENVLIHLFAEVREKAAIPEGTEVIVAGNPEGKEARCEVVSEILSKSVECFDTEDNQGHVAVQEEKVTEESKKSVAFKANGTSSYVTACVDITSLGLKTTGELQLLLAIMEDVYLTPEFRFQLGAYGANTSLNIYGRYKFTLFRAPSYIEALMRLPEIPGEMEGILAEMTEEDLAGYQLSLVSGMMQPSGTLNEAMQQIIYQRRGIEPEERQALLEQICNASVESLIQALPDLQKIIDAAGSAVVAPGTAVDEHPEMFESVVVLP